MTSFCCALLGLVAVVLAVFSTHPAGQFGFAMFGAACGFAAILTVKGDV